MNQITALWNALDPKRRMAVIGATLAMFVAVLLLARIATAPGMSLLYGGLESGPAGEVVQVLEQRGLRYEVRGDAIWVETRMRDETRMTLAAQGLPTNNSAGYELLDGLSGFGTTAQMFDAAYWRAKEGELARTIVAGPHVRAARVHIAHGTGQGFRRDLAPTASVTVTTGAGTLSPAQAQALRHLVASAVAGLKPEAVSVIDSAGGLVQSREESAGTGLSGADRAAAIRRNVERLLEAHVGHGRAVVEVNIDTVTERESIVERRFDPEGRVAISTETEERNSTASGARDNGVTVASNLPAGDAGAGTGSSQSRDNETRERVNYEVSETHRELLRAPGATRRLTVAVLVDGIREIQPDGQVSWQARPESELDILRELVASAVGFDAARGDVITLRSLPFEPVPEAGTMAQPGLLEQFRLDLMSLIQLGVMAVVVMVLALFVLRPLLVAARASPRDGDESALLKLPGTGGAAGTGPVASLASGIAGDGPGGIDLPVFSGDFGEPAESDPVARLRRLINERQEETAAIIHGWMEEREERG